MSAQARSPASLAGFAMRGAGDKGPRAKDGDITRRVAAALPQAAPPPPPPAPAPAAARPPATARPIVDEPPPRPEEIVVYWERLRRGRALPPLADLDRALVAKGWPDSLVVVFNDESPSMPRISRLGATDGAIEYTPMVTDWILTRARHASRHAVKLDEVLSFPLGDETPHYRLFLLPLGSGSGPSDGVLCHLCRVA